MNDITPSDSERIIEAAAAGRETDTHGGVSRVLTSLHAGGATDDSAPVIGLPRRRAAGRVARRTAVAATAAVLGVASMAAAESGVFDPILPGPDPVVALADDEPEDAPEIAEATDEQAPIVEESPAAEDGDGPETTTDEPVETAERPRGPEVDIDGVDPSDGVDDAELEIACAAVGNHGEYVRLVARDRLTEHDGTHGDRVSEAAATDCGKPDADDPDDDDEDAGDADDAADDDADADDDDGDEDDTRGPGKGKGHEKSNGRGHGQGKGLGHAKDVIDD